jgi:hypothetical protein
MTFVTYQSANDVVDRFIELLGTLGISPAAGSVAETELLSMTQLLHDWKTPETFASNPQLLRDAAGAHDLAAKVLCARQCPEFPELIAHLEAIVKAPDYSRMTLMAKGDGRDDLSRKYAELYLACLAIHCGINLQLDHPTRSKGDNPDVMFEFAGSTWALAVKTISSTQGQSVYENLIKAADQIDRSAAEHGLIVINTKNVLDHAALWNAEFESEQQAVAAMTAKVGAVCANAEKDRSEDEWKKVFDRPKLSTPVLFVAQSLVSLRMGSFMVPTPLKAIVVESFGHTPHHDAIELAQSMNILMALLVGSEMPPLPEL